MIVAAGDTLEIDPTLAVRAARTADRARPWPSVERHTILDALERVTAARSTAPAAPPRRWG